MRTLILNMLLFLSLFVGGRSVFAESPELSLTDWHIYECSEAERLTEFSLNKDICLTPAQGYSLSGSGTSVSISVRTTSSGRNSQHRHMHTSFLSGGKLVNINSINQFLNRSSFILSGTETSERYLLSIRRLRL